MSHCELDGHVMTQWSILSYPRPYKGQPVEIGGVRCEVGLPPHLDINSSGLKILSGRACRICEFYQVRMHPPFKIKDLLAEHPLTDVVWAKRSMQKPSHPIDS